MSDTFDATADPVNSITVGNTTESVEGEVTIDRVKEVARDNGVKNFKVEDSEGNGLDQDQFPYNGDVVVREYNENA